MQATRMRRMRWWVVAGLVLAAGAAPAAAQGACTFTLGLAMLRAMVGAQTVGSCLENERHNPANGNAEQRTTNGLLVWRKADNWTAFTDGYRTWLNGPLGLQVRLNTERFAWESDAGPVAVPPPPALPPPPPPAPPVLAPNGLARTVRFFSASELPFHTVTDPNGQTRTVYASGRYLAVQVYVRNNLPYGDPLWATQFTLVDAQGRTYRSDFVVRQVPASGQSVSYEGLQITPGGTVQVLLQFDVARDATGLTLLTDGGNLVAVVS